MNDWRMTLLVIVFVVFIYVAMLATVAAAYYQATGCWTSINCEPTWSDEREDDDPSEVLDVTDLFGYDRRIF